MQQRFACFSHMNLVHFCTAVTAVLMSWATEKAYSAIFFEVPSGLSDVEGNAASRLPFGYPTPVRYQQVFDVSQFTLVPTGGAFLTRIFPRADCSSTFKWLVTNLQVNLSTTLKSPDNLSAIFAENFGADEIGVCSRICG